MDILTLFSFLEPIEILRHLDVDALISLYLTSVSLQEMTIQAVPSLAIYHHFPKETVTFNELVILFDIRTLTPRTHKYIGLNKTLSKAAKSGNLSLVRHLLSKGANKYGEAAAKAAKYGHLHVVDHLYMDRYSEIIMTEAVYSNHMDVVNYILEKGDPYYMEDVVQGAAYNGNVGLIKRISDGSIDITFQAARGNQRHLLNHLCLQAAIDGVSQDDTLSSNFQVVRSDIEDCMCGAIVGGHIQLVQEMLDRGVTVGIIHLIHASCNGREDIVDLLLSWSIVPDDDCLPGSTLSIFNKLLIVMDSNSGSSIAFTRDYNSYMTIASHEGNIDIVHRCLELGANNYDECLRSASYYGRCEIVLLMLSRDADPNAGLCYACERGHLDIVYILLSHGADNYNDGILSAIDEEHIDIVTLMLDRGADNFEECAGLMMENRSEYLLDWLSESGREIREFIEISI